MYFLYSIQPYFSQCHANITPNIYIFQNSILLLLNFDIAHPNIYIFLKLFYFEILVYCCELLDATALLELGTQAFRYTRNYIF